MRWRRVRTCMVRRSQRLAWSQRWLATGLSVALGWGVLTSRSSGPPVDEVVALWVCDRAAEALIGLSAEGLSVGRVSVAWPRRLVACGEGELWVLCGAGPGPRAATSLRHMGRDGALGPELPMQGVRALAGGRDGALFALLDDGEGAHLERISRDRTRRRLRPCSREARLSSDSLGRAWLLEPGELSCFGAASGVQRCRRDLAVSGGVEDFAWAGDSGWALERSSTGALQLLHLTAGGEVAPLATLEALREPIRLAPSGSNAVWVVSEDGRALRVDSSGALLGSGEFPMLGIEAVLAADGGGVWALSGGALMRLSREGVARPGQGGFRYAVDLSVSSPP